MTLWAPFEEFHPFSQYCSAIFLYLVAVHLDCNSDGRYHHRTIQQLQV